MLDQINRLLSEAEEIEEAGRRIEARPSIRTGRIPIDPNDVEDVAFRPVTCHSNQAADGQESRERPASKESVDADGIQGQIAALGHNIEALRCRQSVLEARLAEMESESFLSGLRRLIKRHTSFLSRNH